MHRRKDAEKNKIIFDRDKRNKEGQDQVSPHRPSLSFLQNALPDSLRLRV